MTLEITLPNANEYFEYYGRYIEPAAACGDVLAALPKQIDEIKSALGNLSDEQALFRDAPNEWTIKEVMGHMNDVERIFSYRLLCISRADQTPSPALNRMITSASRGSTLTPSLIWSTSLCFCAVRTFLRSRI